MVVITAFCKMIAARQDYPYLRYWVTNRLFFLFEWLAWPNIQLRHTGHVTQDIKWTMVCGKTPHKYRRNPTYGEYLYSGRPECADYILVIIIIPIIE